MIDSGGLKPGEVPAAVLAGAGKALILDEDRSGWVFEHLTTTNPAWRLTAAGKSAIIKKSRDPRRDVLVSELFAAFGVVHLGAQVLDGDWVLMQDAGRHTLETMPQALYDIGMFRELGRLAASALLLGMRDRKLGNIAVDGEPGQLRYAHIDYEGAFRSGLVNRLLRPGKYYRYLLARLLFDVARHYGETRIADAYALFSAGFIEEWCRLDKIRAIRGINGKMSPREKIMLAAGRRSPSRAASLLQSAYERLTLER